MTRITPDMPREVAARICIEESGDLVVLPHVRPRLLRIAAVRLSAEKRPAETAAIHDALLRCKVVEIPRRSDARRAREKAAA